MPHIGVISNPNAHALRADPLLSRRLAEIGGRASLVVETRDLDELGHAVREFADRRVAVIASCGGDGSNLSLLTEMVRVYGGNGLPPLAILRGGTVNTVANNLGIHGSPEDIFTRLVACRNRGMAEPAEERSLLKIDDRFGFYFGAAFPAKFYEAYNARPSRGIGWAAVMATRVTLSALFRTAYSRALFAPVAARVLVDGAPLPAERWSLLVASTLMNVGLNVRITYRALERQGHFHLVASGLSGFELAKQFPRAFLARPLSGENHFDVLPAEAVFEFDRSEPFTVDGDVFRAERVVVRTGPTVRLSVP